MDIIISIAVLGGLGLILGIIIGLCNRFLKVDEDDITDLKFNNTYIYQNPFLMSVTINGAVGYYNNNIDE